MTGVSAAVPAAVLLLSLAVVAWPPADTPQRDWAALSPTASQARAHGSAVSRSAAPGRGQRVRGSAPGGLRSIRRRVIGQWGGGDHVVRRTSRPDEALADVLAVLDQVGTALRAGVGPATALAALSRTGSVPQSMRPLVQELLSRAERGEALGPGWLSWSTRYPAAGLNLMARAWMVSEQTGAPLAESVSCAVRMIRAERDQIRLVATTMAQARATMSVLSVLPFAGPVLALAVGVDPSDLLSTPGPTLGSLGAGMILLALGRRWVRRLVAAAVRGPVLR